MMEHVALMQKLVVGLFELEAPAPILSFKISVTIFELYMYVYNRCCVLQRISYLSAICWRELPLGKDIIRSEIV